MIRCYYVQRNTSSLVQLLRDRMWRQSPVSLISVCFLSILSWYSQNHSYNIPTTFPTESEYIMFNCWLWRATVTFVCLKILSYLYLLFLCFFFILFQNIFHHHKWSLSHYFWKLNSRIFILWSTWLRGKQKSIRIYTKDWLFNIL